MLQPLSLCRQLPDASGRLAALSRRKIKRHTIDASSFPVRPLLCVKLPLQTLNLAFNVDVAFEHHVRPFLRPVVIHVLPGVAGRHGVVICLRLRLQRPPHFNSKSTRQTLVDFVRAGLAPQRLLLRVKRTFIRVLRHDAAVQEARQRGQRPRVHVVSYDPPAPRSCHALEQIGGLRARVVRPLSPFWQRRSSGGTRRRRCSRGRGIYYLLCVG